MTDMMTVVIVIVARALALALTLALALARALAVVVVVVVLELVVVVVVAAFLMTRCSEHRKHLGARIARAVSWPRQANALGSLLLTATDSRYWYQFS